MGWGICFALDQNGYVYCADGCKWRSSKADYDDYPEWPSARQAVLDYFQGEARRELDMIRDECPGTAAALREACEEHIGIALGAYDELSDDKKVEEHERVMKKLEEDISNIKTATAHALETYKQCRTQWTEYQKNPPKVKAPKTRAEELQQLIEPLQVELNMELAAQEYDRLKTEKIRTTRLLNREKKFSLQ
jgi:hypothetical protein